MRRYFILFYLLLLITVNPVFAGTKNIKLDIGGARIDIQTPNGLHEISSLSPETRRLVETMVPPTFRLLAVFVSERDLGRIIQKKNPKLHRYIILNVCRKFESINFSDTQFRNVCKVIKKQHDALLNSDKVKDITARWIDSATGKILGESDLKEKIKVGGVIPLGIFLEKPHAIGFANLIKVESEIEGKKLDYIMARSDLYLLARGRFLYAYVFSIYKTQDDLDWVKSKSKEWAESF